MSFEIDGTLYPDVDPPDRLESLGDRIDFLARLCGAWDFGILPDWETVIEVRKPQWREAVEATNMLSSPAYHLLRRWQGLGAVPFLGSVSPDIRDDPSLAFV